MPKCKLCLKTEADQTGSHILTYSWIKSAINESGQTRRDQEFAYSISSLHFTNRFVGRSISPDKIQEEIGRELTDAEIDANQNFFTADYIVCRNCEKRFTVAENYFNEALHLKLKNKSIPCTPIKNGTNIAVLNENDFQIDLVRLNIYIQFWRASVARFDNFSLSNKNQEHLRRIIDSVLDTSFEQTLKNCQNQRDDIRSIPLVMTFMETIEASTDFSVKPSSFTSNNIFFSKGRIPYFSIINDICIQLYEKEKHIRSSIDYMFGINDIIDISSEVNLKESQFIVGVINDDLRQVVNNRLRMLLYKNVRRILGSSFSRAHRAVFGVKPTMEVYLEAMKEVAGLNDFTSEEISGAFAKVLVNVKSR